MQNNVEKLLKQDLRLDSSEVLWHGMFQAAIRSYKTIGISQISFHDLSLIIILRDCFSISMYSSLNDQPVSSYSLLDSNNPLNVYLNQQLIHLLA